MEYVRLWARNEREIDAIKDVYSSNGCISGIVVVLNHKAIIENDDLIPVHMVCIPV